MCTVQSTSRDACNCRFNLKESFLILVLFWFDLFFFGLSCDGRRHNSQSTDNIKSIRKINCSIVQYYLKTSEVPRF